MQNTGVINISFILPTHLLNLIHIIVKAVKAVMTMLCIVWKHDHSVCCKEYYRFSLKGNKRQNCASLICL